MSFDVSVARFSLVSDYVVYDLQVSYRGQAWTLKKRYSEFYDFYLGIQTVEPSHPLPSFPPKHPFGGNDPGVCINRVIALDTYMKAVVAIQRYAESLETTLFLETYTHIQQENKPKILIPLPDFEFDPSEVAIPWKLMSMCGFDVYFATEKGATPQADPLLTRDEGVIFGQLGASPIAKRYYFEMEKCEDFQHPLTWDNLNMEDFDGLLLGGGHAPGMKQYLENETLQKKVSQFFLLLRPVAAICHGVLLAARSKDLTTGESVLYGKKTTTLPKYMENLAYAVTYWKYGKLYRTYDVYCADEVCSYLRDPETDFIVGPLFGHGSMFDDSGAHVVQDDLYISGRYPGDAFLLAKKFIRRVLSFLEGD